jgi:hypothetical protein
VQTNTPGEICLNDEAPPGSIARVTRPTLMALFAIASISGPFQTATAEPTDEKPIYDLLDAFVGAQLDSDFPRLVSLLLPSTQRLFRDQLSARFDELLRVYSVEQISAVSGLPAHPKDLKLSDPEFFVVACEQAKARHPDFVGDPKWLPCDIRDTVFHENGRVDVTLSYSGRVQTERTDYSFILPFVIALQREQSRWQVLSCPLAHVIAWNWSHDLACPIRSRR